MLPIHLNSAQDNENSLLEQLNQGIPSIWQMAKMCTAAQAQANGVGNTESSNSKANTIDLSLECQTLLWLARNRGSFDIKFDRNAFESSERVLTVHVEVDENSWQPCRVARNIRKNIAFLEAFMSLCRLGLVLHHVSTEFTLSGRGFERADNISEDEIKAEIEKLVTIDH